MKKPGVRAGRLRLGQLPGCRLAADRLPDAVKPDGPGAALIRHYGPEGLGCQPTASPHFGVPERPTPSLGAEVAFS